MPVRYLKQAEVATLLKMGEHKDKDILVLPANGKFYSQIVTDKYAYEERGSLPAMKKAIEQILASSGRKVLVMRRGDVEILTITGTRRGQYLTAEGEELNTYTCNFYKEDEQLLGDVRAIKAQMEADRQAYNAEQQRLQEAYSEKRKAKRERILSMIKERGVEVDPEDILKQGAEVGAAYSKEG
jgi:uncharacterized beta-barrel protein YwiB (DUF1934 family)